MNHLLLEAIRMILGPQGERWSPVPPPGYRMVSAVELLEPGALTQTLERLAAHLGTTNLRAVASLWHKNYVATLLIPVLNALTIARAGLDASAVNVRLALDESGLPKRLVLLESTSVLADANSVRELQASVLHAVREQHLSPLIDRLREVTGVPRRVLWTNVANLVADVYDNLSDHPAAAAAAAEDRTVLLDCPTDLITGGPNPLHSLVRYEPIDVPGLPDEARCRRACCQRYSLPGYQACYTCPRLSLDERVAAMTAHKNK